VNAGTDDPLDQLPHQPPFRFLTRIDSLERGVRARGAWIVRGDEDFLRGHFPGEPLVPGVLIGEALAQLSGVIGVELGAPGRLAHIDVRFRAGVAPPAELQLVSSRVRSLGALAMYDVAARVNGDIVAEGRIVLREA
jgi:3-hydroxyacyl-[acyl-carrier-protein] dehydratase